MSDAFNRQSSDKDFTHSTPGVATNKDQSHEPDAFPTTGGGGKRIREADGLDVEDGMGFTAKLGERGSKHIKSRMEIEEADSVMAAGGEIGKGVIH